ncbi:MAG TPA: branched-chain amino acid aminotransferase [Steroidobacteraceae bacterium]|nr:branched-chain amino acid aminotransferase [Steroidobacteraceae bacterium]
MNAKIQETPQRPAFGTVLAEQMAVATYANGAWSKHEIRPTGPLPMHPAAHVLHYASTCFEGFKAYRGPAGSVNVFRLDKHIERMRQSARLLALPEPDPAQLAEMVRTVIDRCRASVPEAPGALYMRPMLFGTMPNIGAAATPSNEATLIVLASPVWDYFAGGMKPLRIFVDDKNHRTADHLGMVKTGGNYAAAMGPTLAARKQYNVDQVLFCPGGQVQETGAANFLLIREGHLLTRSLDSTFLHGVTRDSLLHMARADGYRVEERKFDVAEMLEWVRNGEAALSGTAAVLAGVGTLVHAGKEHRVGTGDIGSVTRKLRSQLVAIQQGDAPDRFGWLTPV